MNEICIRYSYVHGKRLPSCLLPNNWDASPNSRNKTCAPKSACASHPVLALTSPASCWLWCQGLTMISNGHGMVDNGALMLDNGSLVVGNGELIVDNGWSQWLVMSNQWLMNNNHQELGQELIGHSNGVVSVGPHLVIGCSNIAGFNDNQDHTTQSRH